MLASLDNEVVFKKAFTNPLVLSSFVKDILGIDFQTNKIETEKKFSPKVGRINFAYDIFAESKDQRVIVELQRIEYDYNFDRFLHYFMMAIGELQRKSKEYKIDQKVYTIIILIAPYTVKNAGLPIKDEVLISSLDPRNLKGKVVPLYGHKLIFLNPNYRNSKTTPQNYLDWLNLIYDSIHSPEDYNLNLSNPGISQAIKMIDYDQLSPEEVQKMKVGEAKKATLKLYEHRAFSAEKKADEQQQRADEQQQRADEQQQRADEQQQRADSLEQKRKKAEKEKQKAEKEKQKAEKREKALLKALKKAGIDPNKI